MKSPPTQIRPLSLPFDAELTLPGSKSHANRAIIAACLAKGTTTITNATPCDDVSLLVENVQRMGYRAEWQNKAKGVLVINGGKPVEQLSATLSCHNAGTTLRFLTSLACITPGHWTITGSERMLQRPIGDLTAALKALGADIDDTNGFPPLRINGKNLPCGNITLDASKSSQFLSSLLLIGSSLASGLNVTLKNSLASPGYIALTEKVLKDFGAQVQKSNNTFSVIPTKLHSISHYAIEGDWSAAGAFLVLAELTGSRIRFSNLTGESLQSDRLIPRLIKKLRGLGPLTIDCTETPDQLMNLAILAAHREGTTIFTGAGNLRIKETDRLHVLAEELKKVGITSEETPDGIIIRSTTHYPLPTTHCVIDPHHDHRFVMAFAILGSMMPGIEVADPECVCKSYPDFLRDLQSLHSSPRCIAIVGMRGCGKTNLAKGASKKLKLRRIDIDMEFKKSHGDIASFVKEKGWPAFRKIEEELVAASLKPGIVVALGGGAIESANTRKLLKTEALTIWIQTTQAELLRRLKDSKRPALTSLPLKQEIAEVLKKRTPLYQEVAVMELKDTIRPSELATKLCSLLRERCSW
ncbi:MAG: 3-phosphoshikimate 1-carboxyvinyltransferase [Candidatus Peregrinibacteria bacterium]